MRDFFISKNNYTFPHIHHCLCHLKIPCPPQYSIRRYFCSAPLYWWLIRRLAPPDMVDSLMQKTHTVPPDNFPLDPRHFHHMVGNTLAMSLYTPPPNWYNSDKLFRCHRHHHHHHHHHRHPWYTYNTVWIHSDNHHPD